MKKLITKLSALALACAVMTGTSACSDKGDSDQSDHHNHENLAAANVSGDVAEEDLPYGSTMSQLLTKSRDDLNISIEYDNRFLSEEEACVVSNYLYALENCDTDLMAKTFYPPFFEYSAQNSGYSSTKEYLEAFNANLIESISEYVEKEVTQFDIDYIMIDECLTSADDKIGSDLDNMDKLIAESIGQEHLDKTEADSRKELCIDFTYKVNGEADSYDYNYGIGHTITLFLYKIDGNYYIV